MNTDGNKYWRVHTSIGVMQVPVGRSKDGARWRCGKHSASTPHLAIVLWCTEKHYAPIEILPPGAPTRDELVAEAVVSTIAAVRNRCVEMLDKRRAEIVSTGAHGTITWELGKLAQEMERTI